MRGPRPRVVAPEAPAQPVFLGGAEERRIAVAANCDPRSVRKYVNGLRVSPLTRRRIEDALRTLGLDRLVHS